MSLIKIINGEELHKTLKMILMRIHSQGPIEASDFEKLAYAKKFHADIFSRYEQMLLNFVGLFYKASKPNNLLGEVYSIMADSIELETGNRFTPVQADAFKKIRDNVYFSFSAPTSAGKSYLFREMINRYYGDIVIMVPSRALIAEYMIILEALVDTETMVLQFVEIVNIKKTKRRIFILTPERGVEIFKHIPKLAIDLILFDEAQISEEEVRGMRFDSFVRRIDKFLPEVKKVFTHPFVLNPEAQLSKHDFYDHSAAFCYKQNSVGKIFLSIENERFNYFSPYKFNETELLNSVEDIVKEKLKRNGTALIYTSKTKIYDRTYLIEFDRYIQLCDKLTDPKALTYIEELRAFIGASKSGNKHSSLIEMMERGIVIHHGSIPLKARLIIEAFVNDNFAKICFSTSTLIQGINMPFDIVWISDFRFTGSDSKKILDLKNLIGRAGRSTGIVDSFDYGYVIIEKKNVPTFITRLQEPSVIKPISQLAEEVKNIDIDLIDIVDAMKKDDFNDELHLTNTQVRRIEEFDVDKDIRYILDNLILDNKVLTGKKYYSLSDHYRRKIKQSFERIFVAHLRRKELNKGEKSILSASIPILLWQIQGRSFAEMVNLRHGYLTSRRLVRDIRNRVKRKEITGSDAKRQLAEIKILRSPMAAPLPDSKVRAPSLFNSDESIVDLDYDKLVYDTYDYLDKVIGQSLTDPICGALQLFNNKYSDERAIALYNYIKYGTNETKEIWLLKYGFSYDDVDWIKNYIDSIDENEIVFSRTIRELSPAQQETIKKYI
ncbi:DEAD/DEAH box helicase [Fluviicola taffensis]|uniref:Helicase domain protein n=1 Tax=Fluviicola taffensis (strain DSM 16823 / NCIMB 13979 / RW262) TaxID=755732 RepID=F2I9W3_FLUTR|nr:DEAD/DEAH box helicase [Fluviicola taffensis]AEA44121.1 helicase domain protein [Fluviicola taffensis DSM 16823]